MRAPIREEFSENEQLEQRRARKARFEESDQAAVRPGPPSQTRAFSHFSISHPSCTLSCVDPDWTTNAERPRAPGFLQPTKSEVHCRLRFRLFLAEISLRLGSSVCASFPGN
jgi:hypothetical protein